MVLMLERFMRSEHQVPVYPSLHLQEQPLSEKVVVVDVELVLETASPLPLH